MLDCKSLHGRTVIAYRVGKHERRIVTQQLVTLKTTKGESQRLSLITIIYHRRTISKAMLLAKLQMTTIATYDAMFAFIPTDTQFRSNA